MSKPIKTILQAVQKHPLMMSPVLLEYLLRGEIIGRMSEKGLLESPFHAALVDEKSHEITAAVAHCLEQGWLARTSGFYPALILTSAGELRLAAATNPAVEASPEQAYRLYYKWRQNTARTMRKPPYRIFPNITVNHLAVICPTTLEELLGVPGLGKRRALRYQNELLAVGRELNRKVGG
ncbi:MAG: recQ [Cyanobacteria bacterium RYN_339]|nr:recQ [Cyanobacteria bacterium RYN_339]